MAATDNSSQMDRPSICLSFEEAARKYCRDATISKTNRTATEVAADFPIISFAVITRSDQLWSYTGNQITLKYRFLSGTIHQHNKVKQAIQEWTWYANVAFEEIPTGASGEQIRISFDPNVSDGSWSLVGMECLDANEDDSTMNLGWIQAETDDMTAGERAVILHEVSWQIKY